MTVTPAIQYGVVPVFIDVTIPQYNWERVAQFIRIIRCFIRLSGHLEIGGVNVYALLTGIIFAVIDLTSSMENFR